MTMAPSPDTPGASNFQIGASAAAQGGQSTAPCQAAQRRVASDCAAPSCAAVVDLDAAVLVRWLVLERGRVT